LGLYSRTCGPAALTHCVAVSGTSKMPIFFYLHQLLWERVPLLRSTPVIMLSCIHTIVRVSPHLLENYFMLVLILYSFILFILLYSIRKISRKWHPEFVFYDMYYMLCTYNILYTIYIPVHTSQHSVCTCTVSITVCILQNVRL
jgi:hypothetical protein